MGRPQKMNELGAGPRERIVDAARTLFGKKGFYATTTAELAQEAGVSTGQIYRFFESKDDIVLAIVEENVRARVAEMDAIFDSVERGEQTVLDALRRIAEISLVNAYGSLSFEILAEACRNEPVAERLKMLTESYRQGVRRLALLVRPGASFEELDAYIDIMMACFIGLSHSPAVSRPEALEHMIENTARLMMRALTAK